MMLSQPFQIKNSFKLYTIILCGIVNLNCLSACSSLDPCSNDILAEYTNQAKTYKIVEFDRDCGATTGNSIQLSVIATDDDLENDGGNIFIASSKSGDNFENSKPVLVSWLNDHTIKVKYDTRLNIFKKESKKGKFNIVYEETLVQ